jgi:hypothetical protein
MKKMRSFCNCLAKNPYCGEPFCLGRDSEKYWGSRREYANHRIREIGLKLIPIEIVCDLIKIAVLVFTIHLITFIVEMFVK